MMNGNGTNTQVEQLLLERLHAERAHREGDTPEDIFHQVLSGDDVEARGNLLFFTKPHELWRTIDAVVDRLKGETADASIERKVGFARFLTLLSIDLATFIPEWILAKTLSRTEIDGVARKVLDALKEVELQETAAQGELMSYFRGNTRSRLKAEGVAESAGLDEQLNTMMGTRLSDFAASIIREARASNLFAAAKANLEGRLATEIGNDYADFLQYTMWLGASFVTTNPVLIKAAWEIDPKYWDDEVDRIIASRLSRDELKSVLAGSPESLAGTIEKLNRDVTISVVERNCRLLRPIFLVTEGARGYVSLQVNPEAHNDAERMVREAKAIYAELETKLGGVPNVVIKVPSTSAGLEAARQLTAVGIGVTVTLTFSVFQSLRFARVLDSGHTLVSYIAIMNGRLAFPIRDELDRGNVAGGTDAARWSGIEVARKVNRIIYAPRERGGFGIDPRKVKIMIASLRIYGDWIPDISELWGVPLVTIFPNVRRAFDTLKRPLRMNAVADGTPEEEVRVLLSSELFRQAWWREEEGTAGKPNRELTLNEEDAEAVAQWTPVMETLTQFIGSYQQMGEMVRKRMERVIATQR